MSHRWKRLRRVSVTNPGDQYIAPPAVTVDPPAAPKQEAKATATVSGGAINAVNMDSGGNFYATVPTITISAPDSGGTQAVATATISGGEVTGVNISNAGAGYSTPPTITIAKSTDLKSAFTAQVNLTFDSAAGTVTKVNVIDSGNFYDSANPPNVTIAAPFSSTSFERGEDVTIQANSTGTIVSGEVAEFKDSSVQTLSLIHTASTSGTLTEPGVGLAITGSTSGASRKISKVTIPDTNANQTDEFDAEAQNFLDFTETNPFGEPEAATLVQEATAAATAAAAPATAMVIKGTVSDPPFTRVKKSYKVVGNSLTYNFEADSSDGNYIEGLNNLSVPGFALSTHTDSSVTNAMQITYTPQVTNDTLTLAGDGFIQIGIPEGNYQLNESDASSPTVGALQAGDSAAIRFGDSAVAAESDGSFFRSAATQLIATVNTGKLYTGPNGNVFYLAINEGYIDSGVTDSSMLTNSSFTVTLDSGQGYGGGYGKVFSVAGSSGSGGSALVWYGDRAISTHSDNVQMDYWDITNSSVNAADFGDTIGGGHYSSGGISNGSRGIFTGGNSNTNVIQYITTSTLGNAIDFGDMTRNNFGTGNTSDNTRGIIAGGANPPSDVGQGWNGIEYITIATTSNGTNFGNLAQSREHSAGASNGTRGAIAGGQSPAAINNIDYVTIQTTANAIDFGDLVVARRFLGGTGNATRATFVGGEISGQGNQMDAVDLSTLSNATDWGDLALARQGLSVTGNADYGTAGGGQLPADPGGSLYDRIDRWSFATSGNATAIGDITSGRAYGGAVSGNAA